MGVACPPVFYLIQSNPKAGALEIATISKISSKKQKKNRFGCALLQNRPKSMQKQSEVYPNSREKTISEIGAEVSRFLAAN